MTVQDFSVQPDHDRPQYRSSPPVLVAVTGATGSVYGLVLVQKLLGEGIPVRLSFTKAACRVTEEETGKTVQSWVEEFKEIARDRLSERGYAASTAGDALFAHDSVDDIGAPGASGSFRARGMIVAPCSMGTLGRIASGISGNLIEREADVCMKERRPLILLARETPLSAIHLGNMLTLTQAGAVIMPPVPAFYARPETIDDLVNHTVDRALDLLGIFPARAFRWGENRTDAARAAPEARASRDRKRPSKDSGNPGISG